MSARWFDDEPAEQQLRRKRDRPQGRRRMDDLSAAAEEDIADDTVRRLVSRGLISEVVAELKSGKEATAYVARSPRGSALLKIYRDLDARSFKNDRVYREGQVILDKRAERAMLGRSRAGLQMLQRDWVMAEYAHLWTLWRAGLTVPEPLAGPRPDDYSETVPAVLMALVGTEDHPAPRLSDASLNPDGARRAWEQSVDGLAQLLKLGFVHGDYSTYNLLWWENTVTIIDFPQLVTRQNPNFQGLLVRDVHSLVTSFRKHGVHADPDSVLRDVRRRAQGPAPEPRLVLP